MNGILRSCLAAVLVAMLPVAASAQNAQVGQVRGAVTDATGLALPGVVITLTSDERGFSRVSVTNARGEYLFPVVPLGVYAVRMALDGFEIKTLTDNLVEAEKTTTISAALALATVQEVTTVVGEVPIVDRGNQTQQTRLRADEFQRMPYARSYLNVFEQAPGVVGTGNANSHGSLRSNNVFLFDGVNTTDPATGTFMALSNFEAIQEIVVRTSAVGVEFGRATGAVVEVITKSGSNRFGGSFKYLMTNDDWNAQNTTRSEVAGADGAFADLGRNKFDQLNPTYSATLGGPIVMDRVWFFGAFESAKTTTPERQTNARPGFANDDYQQETNSPVRTLRIDSQIAPSQNFWFRYAGDPTDGFVNDYWGNAAEREALTAQNQDGYNVSAQYSGVLGYNWTASAMLASSSGEIIVTTFDPSSLDDGAPYVDVDDGRFYNGATFDGRVKRPRTQAGGALEYFRSGPRATHAVKFGADWQRLESESHFRFPTSRLFYVQDFNPVTRTFTPMFYEDYDDDPSVSKGDQVAFYIRDRVQTSRLSLEPGVRIEHQSGTSDIGETTVDTWTIAPRVSASYALDESGRTLVVGSFGRFHDAILQEFSDAFASVPQQGSYDVYVWDGSGYVFDNRVEQGGNTFMPNTGISPRHMDEFTVGVERQVSNVFGVTARYIHRTWGNFIDDVQRFNADGSLTRTVENVDQAERDFRGFEVTLEKRLSNQWSGSASYAYGRTRGNHFADVFTTLGDFADSMCTSSDPGLAVMPCGDVAANLDGTPAYDRPHQVKFNGAYTRPVGPLDVTAGVVGNTSSKATYSKARTVSVLLPSGSPSGQTQTYYYEPLGSERVDGMLFELDLSVEAAVRSYRRAEVGFKLDVFNLFNDQSKINVNNTAWCNSVGTAACQGAVETFGTATSRGSFNAPRTFRFTFLLRY